MFIMWLVVMYSTYYMIIFPQYQWDVFFNSFMNKRFLSIFTHMISSSTSKSFFHVPSHWKCLLTMVTNIQFFLCMDGIMLFQWTTAKMPSDSFHRYTAFLQNVCGCSSSTQFSRNQLLNGSHLYTFAHV